MERRVQARGQWQGEECEALWEAESGLHVGRNSFSSSFLLPLLPCSSLTSDPSSGPHVFLLPPLNHPLFSPLTRLLTTIASTQRNLQNLPCFLHIFLNGKRVLNLLIFCHQSKPRSCHLNSTIVISISENISRVQNCPDITI